MRNADFTWTALGFGALLFWSTSVALTRSVSEYLGPLTTGAVVYLVGGSLACVPLLVQPRRLRALAQLPRAYLFGGGGLVVFYTLCWFLAIGLASGRPQAVAVGLTNYLWTPLTVLFAVPILGYRARAWLIPGVLVAFSGVVLASVSQSDEVTWRGFVADLRANSVPYLLALAAAVAWALYSNLSRRWAAHTDGGAMNVFLLAGGIVLLTARLFFPERSEWPVGAIWEIGLYALFPICLAYTFWDIAMRKGRIILLASASYLTPLVSTIISSLYLHVPLRLGLWAGCLLVIAGAVVCRKAIVEKGV